MRRLIARALWRAGECCFRCGRWGQDCPQHAESGCGTIAATRVRRGVPRWLASLVDWRRALP